MEHEFFYKISDLHDIASLESAYKLDSISEGELTDRHILSDDDTAMSKRILSNVGSALYKRLHRRGRGLTKAYEFDAVYNTVPGHIVFKMDFPDTFDEGLIPSIDVALREALVFGLLSEWFSMHRRNIDAQHYSVESEDRFDTAKSLIEMRTEIKRKYKWL